jgi:hypothetical protein
VRCNTVENECVVTSARSKSPLESSSVDRSRHPRVCAFRVRIHPPFRTRPPRPSVAPHSRPSPGPGAAKSVALRRPRHGHSLLKPPPRPPCPRAKRRRAAPPTGPSPRSGSRPCSDTTTGTWTNVPP